jgi:hypothetical protein
VLAFVAGSFVSSKWKSKESTRDFDLPPRLVEFNVCTDCDGDVVETVKNESSMLGQMHTSNEWDSHRFTMHNIEEEASSDDSSDHGDLTVAEECHTAETCGEEDSSDDEGVIGYEVNNKGSGQITMMDIENVVSLELLSSPEMMVDEISNVMKSVGKWQISSSKCVPQNKIGGGIRTGACMAILSQRSSFSVYFDMDRRSVMFSLTTTSQGSEALMKVIRELKEVFVPLTGDKELDAFNDSHISWSMNYRGFWKQIKSTGRDPYEGDLGTLYLEYKWIHMKEVSLEGRATWFPSIIVLSQPVFNLSV